VDPKKGPHEDLEVAKGDGVGSITEGAVRLLVHPQKDPVHPGSQRRTRQGAHEPALSAGALPGPAWRVHAVGCVENTSPYSLMIVTDRMSTTRF
jgi:hypothetical protein